MLTKVQLKLFSENGDITTKFVAKDFPETDPEVLIRNCVLEAMKTAGFTREQVGNVLVLEEDI